MDFEEGEAFAEIINAGRQQTHDPRARVRLAVGGGFILSDARPITIRQVLERAYPRLRRFTSWPYLTARRALRKDVEYQLPLAAQIVEQRGS